MSTPVMGVGDVIDETIAVNSLLRTDIRHEDYVHFVTKINRIRDTFWVPRNVDRVYTSEFNAWFLVEMGNHPSDKIAVIPYNEKRRMTFKGRTFEFEFFDSNYCPGSFMILFSGDFGNYLYTGYCRFDMNMIQYPSLAPFGTTKTLDKLYIDGLYYEMNMDFPSRKQIAQDVITLLRNYPNKQVYLSARLIGMEETLKEIGEAFQQKVEVTPDKFKIVTKLGYADSFTTNRKETRIHTISMSQITRSSMRMRRNKENSIIIALSPMNLTFKPEIIEDFKSLDVYFFPYSDHCSRGEAEALIQTFQPKSVKLILSEKIAATAAKNEMIQLPYKAMKEAGKVKFHVEKAAASSTSTLPGEDDSSDDDLVAHLPPPFPQPEEPSSSTAEDERPSAIITNASLATISQMLHLLNANVSPPDHWPIAGNSNTN